MSVAAFTSRPSPAPDDEHRSSSLRLFLGFGWRKSGMQNAASVTFCLLSPHAVAGAHSQRLLSQVGGTAALRPLRVKYAGFTRDRRRSTLPALFGPAKRATNARGFRNHTVGEIKVTRTASVSVSPFLLRLADNS